MKKRDRDDVDTPNSSASNVAPSATANRPKVGRKGPPASTANGAGSVNTSGSGSTDSQKAYTSTLEARLNNLEALLRSIPPGVHNALINKLDGQLAAGAESGSSTDPHTNMQGVMGSTGAGSAPDLVNLLRQQGSQQAHMQVGTSAPAGLGPSNPDRLNQLNRNGSGINLANLAIPPHSAFGVDMNANNGGGSYASGSQSSGAFGGLNSNALRNGNVGLGSYSIGLAPSSSDNNYTANPMAGLTYGDFELNQPTLEDFTAEQDDDSVLDALNDVERGMQGLNLSNGYLYVDEIGQTKWQGKARKSSDSRICLSLIAHRLPMSLCR